MRSRMVTLATVLAVLVGLASLTHPVAARYLPTKRGSDSDRLDRLAHLIKELLAESDAAPMDHTAYDQRVFYKREAPMPFAENAGQAVPQAVPIEGPGAGVRGPEGLSDRPVRAARAARAARSSSN